LRVFPRTKWSLSVVLVGLVLTTAASSQNLTGTVKNGTTDKPDANDDVVLISLSQGMQESGKAKTDAKGNFSVKLDDTKIPHLVRVIHQGVTYHKMAPPGTTSVDVQVFDVGKKVDGISVTADVMRFQAQGNRLEGIRLFAVNNTSSPARTQMNDQNFEFFLPDGATIDQSMAMTAGGQPINSDPVPQKEKNRYAFVYPLRPGETQFQVVYHLPYNGSASVTPKLLYGAQHFVVMVPKSMQFTANSGTAFQAMDDPRQSDAVVQVVSNAEAQQPLGFKITGTGTLGEAGDDSQGPPRPAGGAQSSGAVAGRDSRPGGGLGPPIDAPDPLEKYRWFILGGFAVVLAAGADFVAGRSKSVATADFTPTDIDLPEPKPVARPKAVSGSMILEALKEEMFELELEHKQGRISQADYEKAKAALDQTLERAVKRGSTRT
jgi:hypothetical protein